MSPDVFMDAVTDVTGVVAPDPGSDRAISFTGLMSVSEPLDLLGRWMDACESSAVDRTDLAVQLQLLNGAVLNDRLSSEDGMTVATGHRTFRTIPAFVISCDCSCMDSRRYSLGRRMPRRNAACP